MLIHCPPALARCSAVALGGVDPLACPRVDAWHKRGNRDQLAVTPAGGENISSIEVEQAISAHPAVDECAVIAIPHEVWGVRPKAFVTLKDGTTANQEEIIASCRQRLAHFKRPDAIAFGPLPMTHREGAEVRAARARVGTSAASTN